MNESPLPLAVRAIGTLFNLAMFLLFLAATFLFWTWGGNFLDAAGGLPDVATLRHTVLNPGYAAVALGGFAASGHAVSRILDYGAAWCCYIACFGCGWMSLLGLRWVSHFLFRRVSGA